MITTRGLRLLSIYVVFPWLTPLFELKPVGLQWFCRISGIVILWGVLHYISIKNTVQISGVLGIHTSRRSLFLGQIGDIKFSDGIPVPSTMTPSHALKAVRHILVSTIQLNNRIHTLVPFCLCSCPLLFSLVHLLYPHPRYPHPQQHNHCSMFQNCTQYNPSLNLPLLGVFEYAQRLHRPPDEY
jgi:hypothetical protein